MGPQHIAAENFGVRYDKCSNYVELQWGRSTSLRKTQCDSGLSNCPQASMGPQHIAAENPPTEFQPLQWAGASMGPQHIAAENDE